MGNNEIDNLNETIAQVLRPMKAEQRDSFSLLFHSVLMSELRIESV